MKPATISWPEYLRGYAQLRWRNPSDEQRYHEVKGQQQPLYELYGGNLLNRTGTKIVFVTSTPRSVQAKGHPPWTFRLQCLVTGRVSLAIPYERLIEFGILTEDTQTGGDFLRSRLEIVDRMLPILEKLEKKAAALSPISETSDPFDERYSEYLHSEGWRDLRRRVLMRDRFRCQWTGKASAPGDPLQVHHLTYARLGCEEMDDLITVCRSAHKRHHSVAA